MTTTQSGVIGIPDAHEKGKYTHCRYEVSFNKTRSPKHGLNGSKIVRLVIKVNGTMTAEYDRGWITEPGDEPSQMALCILLYSHN